MLILFNMISSQKVKYFNYINKVKSEMSFLPRVETFSSIAIRSQEYLL